MNYERKREINSKKVERSYANKISRHIILLIANKVTNVSLNI